MPKTTPHDFNGCSGTFPCVNARVAAEDHTRSAMTLVEVLVVLGILAVLASLLLPVLGRSKSIPKGAVCRANQHQISLAFQQYSADYNDYYPQHNSWPNVGGAQGLLAGNGGMVPPIQRPLNKYTGDIKLFKCPSDSGVEVSGDMHSKGLSCFQAWGNSYIVPIGYDQRRVRHVTGILLLPSTNSAHFSIKTSDIAMSPSNKTIQGDWPWFLSDGLDRPWHNSRDNLVLFGDGHVEGLTLTFASESERDAVYDPGWKWW